MDLLWSGLQAALQLILNGDPELLRIAALSVAISLSATLLAAAVGVPLGIGLVTTRSSHLLLMRTLVHTGMGLPPVVVGLGVTLLLWRTGPLGALQLLYTPAAMIFAQFIVAGPLVAGFTWSALELLDPEIRQALRVDGAGILSGGVELVRAAFPQVMVAIAAGFGRAIAEVGASLMVGGNLLGQTRILTTAITLETSRGDFAMAIALGIILLVLAFAVNLILAWQTRLQTS